MTLAAWLAEAKTRLAGQSETPALEAQVLLAEALGRPRAWIMAHGEAHLSDDDLGRLEICLSRREAGEPLPYILGHWEFYGLDLIVTPDVLIPRPETELLVEQALDWLDERKAVQPQPQVVDVGVGSGCIAIALATHRPDLRLVASDISLAALEVAQRNARRCGVAERIAFVQADLLPPGGPYDLICANLPYIPRPALAGLSVSRCEPRLALDGGPDGLKLVRRLLDQAARTPAAPAALLLEIEASQGAAARALAQARFPAAARIEVIPDLAGRDRLLSIRA